MQVGHHMVTCTIIGDTDINMTNPVNAIKHLEVFSPIKFGNTRVDVIGAGATGSNVVLMLAKLGVQNIHVWDFDKVEEHNIANQMFGPKHIGMPKVEAIAEVVEYMTGATITIHNEALKGGEKNLGEVVFLLTDTMKSRKDIGKNCVFMNMKTRLMIETRMGVEFGEIFTTNPNNIMEFNSWEKTLFDESEIVQTTTACGGTTTVGSTATWIASYAIWQFLNWFNGSEIENSITVSMKPVFTQTSRYGLSVAA